MPETIGRYRILERLASDWMDDVYRAFDPMIERPVVVKTFRLPPPAGDAASHDAIKGTFYEEMRRTGALLHPGIATLFDAGELPGGLFMASELVEGPTLADMIAGADLDLPLRLSLLAQVVDALEYARTLGVAHLNLTPTHVLVPADYVLKVTGFGVAAVASALGLRGGSPSRYVAPERAAGLAGDSRSDVFSLARLTLDLLADSGSSPDEAVARMPAHFEPHGVQPEAWATLFERATADAPGERFDSPAAFQLELLFTLGMTAPDAPIAWDATPSPGSLGVYQPAETHSPGTDETSNAPTELSEPNHGGVALENETTWTPRFGTGLPTDPTKG